MIDPRVQPLIEAIEGECDGPAITPETAAAVLAYVDSEANGDAIRAAATARFPTYRGKGDMTLEELLYEYGAHHATDGNEVFTALIGAALAVTQRVPKNVVLYSPATYQFFIAEKSERGDIDGVPVYETLDPITRPSAEAKLVLSDLAAFIRLGVDDNGVSTVRFGPDAWKKIVKAIEEVGK